MNSFTNLLIFLNLIVSIWALGGTSVAIAGGGWFQMEEINLSNNIVNILVANKMCSDKNDCVKKQLVFASGEPWGLDVSIYGINDNRILSQIVAPCSESFF